MVVCVVNSEKKGRFYGIGVGPGDPELLTRKAVRLLREAEVVAAADPGRGTSLALRIAAEHIRGKEILLCPAPMTRDAARLREAWTEGADLLCALLEQGRSVAFVTLGDPTIYSTCGYLFRRVRRRGYEAELVPGVPSFCAAAAAAGLSLCEGEERLLLVPAGSPLLEESLREPGTRVVMKAGRSLPRLRALLGDADAVLTENCGMDGERVLPLAEAESSGYFSTVLVTDRLSEDYYSGK
jgi:precorrin-2/cobalt-factor-2 C20-methyltransferase